MMLLEPQSSDRFIIRSLWFPADAGRPGGPPQLAGPTRRRVHRERAAQWTGWTRARAAATAATGVSSPMSSGACLWALLLLAAALPSRANYKTLLTRYTADPSPLVVGDRLYIYATHDQDDAHSFSMVDYNVFSTADGVNWRDDGIAFSPVHNTTWATNAWAQQTIWHEPLQKFLMYFPGGTPGSQGGVVGVAAATDPRGPFVDYAMGPIAQGEDPTVLVDDDGRAILCTSYGQPGGNVPWCGVLNADMKSLAKNQTAVHIEGLEPGQFFEAPWLFKRQGTYYLSFMTSHDCPCGGPFGYGIGYATNNSTDPLGNYTYRGPLMWPNPKNCAAVSSNATLNSQQCANSAHPSPGGNAHHGFALDWPKGSNQHWIAYHTRNLVVEKGEVSFSQRNVGLDRMYFAEEQKPDDESKAGAGDNPTQQPPGAAIYPVTSTPDWVQQQQFVDPYTVQPAVTMAAADDANGSSLFFSSEPAATTDPAGGQWRTLTNISANDTIRVNGVGLDIFTSQDFGWADKNITARLSCNQDVTVEVRMAAGKGTPRWGDWAAEPMWPTPGQPAMSAVLNEVPHAQINVSASSSGRFSNVSAMLRPGSKPYGVSHQVGGCEEGCPPSTLDLLLTFRSASYAPLGPPPPPLKYFTCFGLGIESCDPRKNQNMTLCFCMKPVGDHGCDPKYPPVVPGPGGHGCFPSDTCGGVCPKGSSNSPAQQQQQRLQMLPPPSALTCSMSSWVFEGPPPPLTPAVAAAAAAPPTAAAAVATSAAAGAVAVAAALSETPDPVATMVALRSRTTGKYVAAMTENRQGDGEVTAGWCHISIEAAWALSETKDGSYNFNAVFNTGALARCDQSSNQECSSGTQGGVGIRYIEGGGSSPGSKAADWRMIGTPDGGVILQAAEAALSWPPTKLLLAPTGLTPTTYDGQLLYTGDHHQIASTNNVSHSCAAVLQDKCLPWLGEPTVTCAKHCSMGGPAGHGEKKKDKPGCKVNPGLPKPYRQICDAATTPTACARFNATCHWVEPPPLSPPPGCTAGEVQEWCDGDGQAAVFDLCKLTVVGQTLIDCGGCRPCCGEKGPPGDCNADQDCPLGAQ